MGRYACSAWGSQDAVQACDSLQGNTGKHVGQSMPREYKRQEDSCDDVRASCAGPYKGTQTLTGNEYRSYIKTMQHSDYPSGSACYCAAWTTALREALGTDTFDFSITFPNGPSLAHWCS